MKGESRMKTNARLLFIAVLTLLAVIGINAQQAQSDEEQIAALRASVERMVANAPPRATPDEGNHRQLLLSLRNRLRDLLIEKRGALKSRIQNLDTPQSQPEEQAHVRELQTVLQVVTEEIQRIDSVISEARARGPLPTNSPVATSAPTPESSPESAESATDSSGVAEGRTFVGGTKRFSRAELKDAAAPPEIASSKEQVSCNSDGRPAVLTGYSQLDEAVCRLAQKVVDGKRPVVLARDLSQMFTILTAKLLKTKTVEGEDYASFVTEAQEIRTDQQMGAGPASSGTTSLVSKGGIPYLFGLALENGAVTKTQSDTTFTFRLNPGGVLNMFADQGFVTGFRQADNDPVLGFLNKTSLGLSFDTSRGTQPGIFTGDKQQLSALTAKIEFVNERDPRHQKYEAEWEKFVADEGVKLAREVWKTTVATVDLGGNRRAFRDPGLEAWLGQMNEDLAKVEKKTGDVTSINEAARVIRENADLVPVDLISEQSIEAITDFAEQDRVYTAAKNRIFDKIARGKVLALEYTNQREVTAPDTSNFNFIAGTGTGARVGLTANGAFTFFHKRPPALSPTSARPGRVRDFQFAGQVDVPFKVRDTQFDFWFSGRYERLLEDATTDAGAIIPNTKGDIAVGQVGLNIPIPGLGMRFPVSFTFANRTEFIKEKEIRGNFGFTFNWDTLFSKLKPF